MKSRYLAAMICAAATNLASLSAQTFSFSNINAPIPDGNPNGYANTQTVSTSTTAIGALTLNINLFGTFNGDIYAYVAHSSGFSVLLNRVGSTASNSFGYDGQGFQVTFSDTAANGDVHLYRNVTTSDAPLTGLWQPDARNVDPHLVTDNSARTAFLSSFDGLDPNGSWTLFLADLSSGNSFTLGSWGFDITPVPEPATYLAAALFLGVMTYREKRRLVSWIKRPSVHGS